MATVADPSSALIGAYLAQGTVGNVGVPGAPIMHYRLVVVPGAHSVSGTVTITQAIAPPGGEIVVQHVTGTIRTTGYGSVTQVVYLEGVYYYTLPPPILLTVTEPFSASLAIDNSWHGKGSFSYGGKHVDNVPVNPAA